MRVPPGGITHMADGTVLVDGGQTLVVSGTTPRGFQKHRKAVLALAGEVGRMLDQEAVAVLTLDRSSVFLVFPE